jgi:hypothetical protein
MTQLLALTKAVKGMTDWTPQSQTFQEISMIENVQIVWKWLKNS